MEPELCRLKEEGSNETMLSTLMDLRGRAESDNKVSEGPSPSHTPPSPFSITLSVLRESHRVNVFFFFFSVLGFARSY